MLQQAAGETAPVVRREKTILAVILVLLFAAVAWEAKYLGITVDEPSHLISAHLYWHGRDRLYPRDMPPVIKIVGGWTSKIMGLPVPPDLGAPGDKRSEWTEGANLIGRIPANRLRRVMFWSRLPMAVFTVLIAFLLWRWGRELFGPPAALLIAAVWALLPTPLAHAALLKNDVASAALYLLFWYTAWRYWRAPSWKWAVAFGVAAALTALSKMSMLFVLPLAPIVILARKRSATAVAAVIASVYAVAMLCYQFELHWTHTKELAELAKDPQIPSWFLMAARVFEWIPIPEGMWTGVVSLFKANSADVPVYLMGQVYYQGHPLYFLFAMLWKFPLPAMMLCALGVIALVKRKWQRSDALWLVPGVLYFGLASTAALQHGVRLVLPSWPFFLLIAGFGVERLLRCRAGRVATAGLMALLFVGTVRNYPHGISHYNEWAGPPTQRAWLLNDSNIDWGQALPDLARFARERGIEKMRLSYFGFDNPDRYFVHGQIELLPPPWGDNGQPDRLKLQPGWHAVSACLLPGHFFIPKFRDYYVEFQHRTPVATPGGSIFVYWVE